MGLELGEEECARKCQLRSLSPEMAEGALRWMSSLEKYIQKRRLECWCKLSFGREGKEEEEPQKIPDMKSVEGRRTREEDQRCQNGAVSNREVCIECIRDVE